MITPLSGVTYDFLVDKPIDIYKKNIMKPLDINKQLKQTQWDSIKGYSFDQKKQLLLALLEIANIGGEPTDEQLKLLDILRAKAFNLNSTAYARIEAIYKKQKKA